MTWFNAALGEPVCPLAGNVANAAFDVIEMR